MGVRKRRDFIHVLLKSITFVRLNSSFMGMKTPNFDHYYIINEKLEGSVALKVMLFQTQ